LDWEIVQVTPSARMKAMGQGRVTQDMPSAQCYEFNS